MDTMRSSNQIWTIATSIRLKLVLAVRHQEWEMSAIKICRTSHSGKVEELCETRFLAFHPVSKLILYKKNEQSHLHKNLCNDLTIHAERKIDWFPFGPRYVRRRPKFVSDYKNNFQYMYIYVI